MLLERLTSLYLASLPWLPGRQPDKTSNELQKIFSEEKASHGLFSWDKVKPNTSLIYQDCFDGFQCARLQVPMDWTVPPEEDIRTVEIAVIRIPATVEVTHPNYGGAIIINPGGPGGSGVGTVLRDGKDLRTLVSAATNSTAADARHFDILSFDPRGVNNSTPYFTCFPDMLQMHAFHLEAAASSALNSSDAAFGLEWARMRALAGTCSERAAEAGIGEFMTTASVARDIIEIAERHGEWREAEALRLLDESRSTVSDVPHVSPRTAEEKQEVMERTKWRQDEEMVLYWGFSYGTVLGATLSAMFPNRIGRAILDGVVDSFDYMRGGWSTNLQDTDIQIAKFGEYCHAGGPKNCAMYDASGPQAISDALVAIINDLKENPLGVPATDTQAGTIATYSDLKQLFWDKTYNPTMTFHNLSIVLDELRHGNGTRLVQDRRAKFTFQRELSDECREQGPYSRACFDDKDGWDISVGAGILCSDGDDQTDMTKTEYWAYVEDLMEQSTLLGDKWAHIRLPCTNWLTRPKTRYTGNFTAQTSNPILFISNTADNVTPLRNALTMSAGFPSSRILRQDSEGHCSISAPSLCTARAIRRYFQSGELPEEGKVCVADRRPLDGFSEEGWPVYPYETGEGKDEEIWGALVRLVRGGH